MAKDKKIRYLGHMERIDDETTTKRVLTGGILRNIK